MDRSRADQRLIAFLRADPDRAGVTDVAEWSRADWNDLLATSYRHGVTPLLYHRLITVHADTPMPSEVIGTLRRSYLQHAAWNMQRYHELGKVMGRCRQEGIPVIALKGAHLAATVYDSIALRPMHDVDVLVRQTDLKKVHKLLVDQGYAASQENEGTSCVSIHLPTYQRACSPCVEVHFNIVGPPFTDRVDVERLFARARTCFIEGIEVLTLCPEDALLHLCLHATHQHGFNNGIRPLYDLVAVLDHCRRELDWKQVVSRSREWGTGKCLYVALSAAEHIAGACIPANVWTDIGDYPDGADAVRCAEELLFKPATVSGNMARLFDDISVGEKLVLVASRVAPPMKTRPELNMNREDTSRSGSSPLWLRYLLRVKGLLARHGRLAWKLLLRDTHAVMGARTENRRSALRDWLAH